VAEVSGSQQGVTAGTQEGDVFVRRSSGLIRAAGTYDVFIFNIGLISVGIAVALNQLIGPALYPGANIALSSLVATIGMIVVGIAYYMWSVSFPRSGGNYVYQSRTLSPGVAFASTFMETVILLFYAALASFLFVAVGLSAGLGALGFITESEGLANVAVWFGKPTGVFITGSLIIVFCGFLPLAGMRRYFSFQRWMFIIAIVGTVVSLVVLWLATRERFVTNLQDLTGLEYTQVISAAVDGGYSNPGFDWGTTLKFLVWPLLPLLGGIQSIGIGGEIKKVSRAQSIGILGAILAAGLVFMAFAGLSNKVFGYDFQGAISYNAGTEQSTEITPYFTVLAGILTNNVVLTVLIVAGFAAWIYFWIPAELIYAQRTMLAWSFDRLTPEPISYVSPRFNTPVVAIFITVAIAIGFMALIAYTTYGTLVLILGILLCWGLSMLAGVLFPYTRKEMFERSPMARYRIGPIPAMSLANLAGLAFMVWWFVLLWNDPIAAGHSARSIWSNVGLLIAGAVIYAVMRTIRRRQGVRLELAFKQIPIE
jgi:amino acid transporter